MHGHSSPLCCPIPLLLLFPLLHFPSLLDTFIHTSKGFFLCFQWENTLLLPFPSPVRNSAQPFLLLQPDPTDSIRCRFPLPDSPAGYPTHILTFLGHLLFKKVSEGFFHTIHRYLLFFILFKWERIWNDPLQSSCIIFLSSLVSLTPVPSLLLIPLLFGFILLVNVPEIFPKTLSVLQERAGNKPPASTGRKSRTFEGKIFMNLF